MAEEHSGLPENARRELKAGEKYVPVVPSGDNVPEVTVRSVLLGIIMCIIFSAAITYLTLKIGTGIEAAIPIAILSVGISFLFKRKSTILENTITIAIGATSGIVAGGAVFVLPALYILKLENYTNPFQLFFIPFLGTILGVMLLIPLRRWFVADMHGKFPFPEGTAITEALVAGKKGGKDAIILLYTMIIGGAYDFFASAMHAWRGVFSTEPIKLLEPLTTKAKAVLNLDTGAAITAMGYIVGIRYASYMAGGGILSTLIIIPLIAYFGQLSGNADLMAMTADDLYGKFARTIGIGGIFMAGIIGIIKFLPIIYNALSKGLVEAIQSRKTHAGDKVVERTDKDIPMFWVLGLTILSIVGMWLYFRYSVLSGQPNPFILALTALISTVLLAFLFNSVSAHAIATIGTTPISGMTMLTLLITCIVMNKMGMMGDDGKVATLLVGGVVCTALSMSGSLITQFKIAYWVGATPKKIQWANIFGSVFAAIVTAYVIIMLATTYGFTRGVGTENALSAPQANAMAAVISSIMSTGAPWYLYALGAMIAFLIWMIGVPPLAFALGMYLPLEINMPILVGAIIAWFVQKSSGKNEKLAAKRNERGTLIASGLIAGGAIMGVAGALIKWIEKMMNITILHDFKNVEYSGNWLSLAMLALLCLYIFWDSRRVKNIE